MHTYHLAQGLKHSSNMVGISNLHNENTKKKKKCREVNVLQEKKLLIIPLLEAITSNFLTYFSLSLRQSHVSAFLVKTWYTEQQICVLEVTRNEESDAPPKTYRNVICLLTRSPNDSHVHQVFRSTCNPSSLSKEFSQIRKKVL